MNKINEKIFSSLPIDSWPILAALSFCSKMNKRNLAKLLNADSFKELFESYSQGITLEIYMNMSTKITISTLKEVERIFESSLADDIRKVQGVVYTPDFVIDFIIQQTIVDFNLPTFTNPVLDPACGSGGFLIGAAKYLSTNYGGSFTEWTQVVCGIDINPKAISNAKLLLDLACLENDNMLSSARFLVADSLIITIPQQLEMLKIETGVIALVTNPPYVKLQNLDANYSKDLTIRYPKISSGAFSLASLFLFNSTAYLTQTGRAGMITLNNIFTSLSARNLRELWMDKRHIWKVIDFRHFAVFDASAYTCLIFLDANRNNRFEYNAVNEMPDAQNLKSLIPSFVPYENLNPEKWRLGDHSSLKLISAMEARGEPLKVLADIKVGFATLRDKAFIGRYENGEPIFLGGDGVVRVLEDDSVHNFLKVSELNGSADLYAFVRPIIYPYDRSAFQRQIISLFDFSHNFPIAYAHLLSWKEILQSRGYTDADEWHQWGRRQSLKAEGPKLLTKTFDLKPNFRLDISDSLFCNGYSIKPREIFDSYEILELQFFLQSRFVYAYCLITSFEISGGYQCYQKNFIENICLPPRNIITQNMDDVDQFEMELCNFYGVSISDLNSVILHYGAENFNAFR